MQLVLDFETYFDQEYSLKKMHTLEYVRDERFHAYGAAVVIDSQKPEWISHDDLRSFVRSLSRPVELVCHNTYFDGLVLFHHYQFVPDAYRDTESMARGLLPHAESHSLDALSKLFNLGTKPSETLDLVKGIRDLPADVEQKLMEYALNDALLTKRLYDKLLPALPEEELELIHLTLQWGCRPILQVDVPRAECALTKIIEEKDDTIKAAGVPLEVLSSQPKFVAELEERGIEVPLKTNAKGKKIPALAKNDLGFQQMMADYPEHRTLFEARMAAKSTIDETRTRRVIEIGSRGTLPMPLKYYGAHTGRWSGTDGLNPQNFRRGSELRKSILAPPGYLLLVADLAQIELRLNAWFNDELYWLQVMRDGIDIYVAAAANHFGVEIDEVTPAQRFFGKTLELGLGYQMGWKKFRTQCALKGINLTEEEAYMAVMKYRSTHREVQRSWQHLSNRLGLMYQEGYEEQYGVVTFVHEGIRLPNGMQLDYSNLTPLENGNWTYGYGKKVKYIYGGKMLENIIQALARIVMGDHLRKIERLDGVTTVSTTHDEVLSVVKEGLIEEVKAEVQDIMTTPPLWAPTLPLAVKTGYAREYSK